MVDFGDVPADVVTRLRSACFKLPDAYEEQAWRGTRWMVRKRTFAHVLTVGTDHPAAYVRAVGATEPVVVMTFRAPGSELDALVGTGHPFFKAGWGFNVVGMVLTEDVDWDEVGELLTDSYCVLAPKKLVALVDRPD
jgi:YjbR protein